MKRETRRKVIMTSLVALALLVGWLHVTREVVAPTLPLGTRLLIAARAVWFYIATFLWPSDLVAVYPRWSTEQARALGVSAAAGLATAALIGAWQRRRLPRAAWFAAGFFVLNIGLVVGVMWFPYMRFSYVADHLAYTATEKLTLYADYSRRIGFSVPAPFEVVDSSDVIGEIALRDNLKLRARLQYDRVHGPLTVTRSYASATLGGEFRAHERVVLDAGITYREGAALQPGGGGDFQDYVVSAGIAIVLK